MLEDPKMSDAYESKFMEGGEVVAREKIISKRLAQVLAGVSAAFLIASPILALATGMAALALPPLVPALILGMMAVTIPVMRIVVTTEHLMVQLGMGSRKIALDAIRKVRVGGVPGAARMWGRKIIKGRWTYSAALGVPDGVIVRYEEKGREKEIFFASRDPNGMVQAIEAARGGVRVRVEESFEAEHELEEHSETDSDMHHADE